MQLVRNPAVQRGARCRCLRPRAGDRQRVGCTWSGCPTASGHGWRSCSRSLTYRDAAARRLRRRRADGGGRAPRPRAAAGPGEHAVRPRSARGRDRHHPERRVQRALRDLAAGHACGTPTTGSSGRAPSSRRWAAAWPTAHGYAVAFLPVGDDDPEVGPADPDGRLRPMTSHRRRLPSLCPGRARRGLSGSGKSTFAREHFGPYEVVSIGLLPRPRLRRRERPDRDRRTPSTCSHSSRASGWPPAGSRWSTPPTCSATPGARWSSWPSTRRTPGRHRARPPRAALPRAQRRPARTATSARMSSASQTSCVARSMRLAKEGFRQGLRPHQRRGGRRSHAVERERLLDRLPRPAGPFDVIGDVHGCLRRARRACSDALGYELDRDDQGRAVDAARRAHGWSSSATWWTAGRTAPGVLRLVMGMVADRSALCVPGQPREQARSGRSTAARSGDPRTRARRSAQLAQRPPEFTERGGRVLRRPGLTPRARRRSARRRARRPPRRPTRAGVGSGPQLRAVRRLHRRDRRVRASRSATRGREYRGRAMVLYGHTPMPGAGWVNNTICVDTGCVFGGKLTRAALPGARSRCRSPPSRSGTSR